MSGGIEEKLFVEEEYGAQLHRWSPYKLFNNVVRIMKSVIEEGMEGWERNLKKICPQFDNNVLLTSLKSELYKSVDINGPELMDAIKESLSIPQDILLPEDAVQVRQYSDQELEDIHKRAADLKKRYEYNQQLISVLEAEVDVLSLLEEVSTEASVWQEVSEKSIDEINCIKEQVELFMSNKEQGIDILPRSTILYSANEIVLEK